MLSYNDYERTVFGYLKNYTKFRTRLKNMQLEIADKQAEIDTFGGAKAAAYGLSAGGSWSELNETERNASKLLELNCLTWRPTVEGSKPCSSASTTR